MIALTQQAGLLNGQTMDLVAEELARPGVTARLGTYAQTLPVHLIDKLRGRGIAIP